MTDTEQGAVNNQAKTWRDHLKNFSGALFMVGLTLLLLEGLIRFTDPWGLSYFNDLLVMGNYRLELDDTRGFIIMDGKHRFSSRFKCMLQRITASNDSNVSVVIKICVMFMR